MMRTTFLLAVAVCTASAMAQTLVVPSAAAAADGNGSTTYPFDVSNGRFIYIYDSTHFTGNGVTFPILISQIRYRANSSTAQTWTGATPTLQMDVSTAPIDYAAISTTWNSNHGLDRATVYNGAFPIPAGASVVGTPGPFYATVTFSQPFLYDPSLGDLTIDTTVLGNTTANTPTLDSVSTVGVANAKRVYSVSNPPAATATAWGADYANVLEFTYTPASGLYSAFQANVTAGNSPLSVNFTDQSFSSAPGGVLSWAWDFDGDNNVDSTLQNPTFVYNNCGTYTVSLTVTDSQHPAATETKTGYIVVDQIAANFTASVNGGFAPATVNFTDTSTGPIAAWQWDFDGDNVVDSTVQNPSWIYGAPGTYTVSLTIVNACRTSTRTRTNLISVLAPGTIPAPPEILEYQFNEVRGQEVANTASTNLMPASGTVNTANWQADPGRAPFRGNEPGFGCLGDSNNVTAANLVSTTGPLNYAGSMSYSWWQRLVVAPPSTSYAFGGTGNGRIFTGGVGALSLTYRGALGTVNVDGTYNVQNNPGVWEHVCLVIDDVAGVATWYFNGVPNTVQNFTPNTHVVAHPLATVGYNGTATTSNYTRNYDMDDFRIYSRALLPIEVTLLSLLPENASAGATGTTCPGTLGTVAIGAAGGNPTLGNASFAVTLSNAEDSRLAALVFGFTPATFGLFDLSPWLGAGCTLGTDPASMNFYITVANSAQQGFPIPNHPSFAGIHVYAQWAVLGTQGATSKVMDINFR